MPKRLKLSTPQEVRRALSRVANMALNGTIDPKTAGVIVSACNAVLSSIRLDEQAAKIAELEKLITEKVK